jgi:predicted metal-dependent hydrolase
MENGDRWTLKRNARSRRLWVRVQRDGSVVVTAPVFAPLAVIERFVRDKSEWITNTVAKMGRYKDDSFLPRDRRSYLAHKEKARALVRSLLAQYAPRYGFAYKKVFIKNLRRNWGSCSELGNLNFNYKLVFLPERLAAYVVVHELCHLKVFDHSAAFWELVAREMPEYKKTRQEMRKYHA